eukprot:4902631-Pleurochrysis_carterae.AAC.2
MESEIHTYLVEKVGWSHPGAPVRPYMKSQLHKPSLLQTSFPRQSSASLQDLAGSVPDISNAVCSLVDGRFCPVPSLGTRALMPPAHAVRAVAATAQQRGALSSTRAAARQLPAGSDVRMQLPGGDVSACFCKLNFRSRKSEVVQLLQVEVTPRQKNVP